MSRTRIRKLTLEARRDIVIAFLGGERIAALSVRYGVSRQRIGQVLDAAGVPPRQHYPALVRNEERETMKRLWRAGHSVRSIARATGRAADTVSRVLADEGLRSSWQRRYKNTPLSST